VSWKSPRRDFSFPVCSSFMRSHNISFYSFFKLCRISKKRRVELFLSRRAMLCTSLSPLPPPAATSRVSPFFTDFKHVRTNTFPLLNGPEASPPQLSNMPLASLSPLNILYIIVVFFFRESPEFSSHSPPPAGAGLARTPL